MDQGPSTSIAGQDFGGFVDEPVSESQPLPITGNSNDEQTNPRPGFTALTLDDVNKMKPVEVDVDSIVYGFSSLQAYKPSMPFDVNITGNCVPCKNIKLLQGIFGVLRKTYSHVEFTLGGDPPIRVLVSIPTGLRSSEVTSDTSEDEFDVEEVVHYDYRKYFLDTILGPAILKLDSDCRSIRKGSGNPFTSKWHLHPADWPKLALEVERLTTEAGTFGLFLFYVALHGLQLPQDAALNIIGRYIDPYRATIVIVQCYFAVEFTMRSSVKAVLVDRRVAQALLSGVKFYPGLGVYDYGYFTADRVGLPHQHLLPMCRYVQAYNPAVHILRRGLSDTSVFTWLLLGGDSCRESSMASLRPIGNCAAQFIAAFRAFLRDAVRGSGVRFECVVSGDTSCAVLSLMATYGTRMSEFCLTNGLLVCSTKDWPYHVKSLMLDTLSRLVDLVEEFQTAHFHNRLLASVFDCEMMLRFFAFGEARDLDYNRVSIIFPCRQIFPVAGGRVGGTTMVSSGMIPHWPEISTDYCRVRFSVMYQLDRSLG
ncbi:uncharacterized protein LOC132952420 [Metopolophium dirhodum]|uniref:uncharacterized protein LOC132952420 n=1 Tax=Metopolophium dirhodum TaxID=44670 RepID=UPI0029901BDC|nr:uncharacterized protein LOC132952420 [Metopolophium dirhodum]